MSRYSNRITWLGLVVFVVGILVLLSTFMAWSGSASGANFASNPTVPVAGGPNNFWVFAGHQFLLLSGLWTLILGAFIMALALGVIYGVRGSRVLVTILLAAAFAVSIINLTAVAGIGLGIGSGPVVLLIFSIVGLLAAMGTLSPVLLRERQPVVMEETEVYAPPKPGMAMR